MASLESTENTHPHSSDNGRREIEELARYDYSQSVNITEEKLYSTKSRRTKRELSPYRYAVLCRTAQAPLPRYYFECLEPARLYRLDCSLAVTCLELGDKRHNCRIL